MSQPTAFDPRPVFLVSALVEKPGVHGHRAWIGNASSTDEATGKAFTAFTLDGFSITSLHTIECKDLRKFAAAPSEETTT